MSSTTTYTIDPLASGNGLTEMNARILQIQTALNNLSDRVDSENTKSCCLRYNVPIASGVAIGTLVYYNTTNSNFAPALAELLSTPGSQGQSVESAKARVEGLIVATNTAGTAGTMLTGGYWESATVAQACLGSTAVSGTYYLSPTNAGHATTDPGEHLRQPVLTYYGDGKIGMGLMYMAHDNHFHSSVTITGTWMTADDLATSLGITKPTGTYWGYKHTADAGFSGFGEMSTATTAIFYNGVLDAKETYILISSGYLWSKTPAEQPAASSVTVFNHYPFAYGSAVLREVVSTNDALSVVQQNGTCQLSLAAYTAGTITNSPLAVSALSGSTMLYTNVVSEATAGPGIVIDKSSDGSIVVSASDLVGNPIDAYSINHAGTAPTSNGLLTFLMFPKSRNSEMVITLPVQDVPTGTTLSALVWGISAASSAALAVKMWFVATPTSSTSVPIITPATDPTVTTSLTLTKVADQFTYCESANSIEVTSSGLLVASLSISSPASDVLMLRTGFKLSVASTAEVEDSAVTPEITNAIKAVGTAGCTISKYNIVYLNPDNGKLHICTSTAGMEDKCMGIAMEAGEDNTNIVYLITGIIQDPNLPTILGYSPTAGSPLYVGPTGIPTQVNPATDDNATYIQRIGVALSSSILQISMGSAIVK